MSRSVAPRPVHLVSCAAAVLPVLLAVTIGVARSEPPIILGIELASPHRLPEDPVRAAIGDLTGRPRLRGVVRDSVDRLWSLGLFSDVRVDEIAEAGGVRLVYRLTLRPHVRNIAYRGRLAIDPAEVATAAGLARDGSAEPERLAKAQGDLEALYHREGFLGARIEIDTRADPATNARDVILRIDPGRRARVGRLEIRGIARASERDVRKALGLREDKPYRDRTLREGVRAVEERLRKDGFFEARVSETHEWDQVTNRVDISLTVTEGPLVRVEFDGAPSLKAQELRDRLTFPLTGVVDEFEVEASARQIEATYREHGYAFASVRGRIVTENMGGLEGPHGPPEGRPPKPPGRSEAPRGVRGRTGETRGAPRVTDRLRPSQQSSAERSIVARTLTGSEPDVVVRFEVNEGPRVRVESVAFTGVPGSVADELRQVIQTRPPRRFEPGLYREDILQRDLRAVATWFESRGFPEAKVGPPEVTFSEDRTRATIVIPIAEGPSVAVGRVEIAGQTIFTVDDLMAALPLAPGVPWNREAAEEGRRSLERKYARRGYHGAQVTAETARRDGVVDVTYRIVEGPQTRIGRILVHGLVETREEIVRRELPFSPGDPLDPEQLVEAQRALAALGLFERVDVEPLRPPPLPSADVDITVRELKPWRVALGGGYSTFEGLRGSLELGRDNLFGTGRSLALRGEISERGNRTDVTLREPRVLGTRWLGTIGLFYEFRREIGFELERFGVTAGVERDLGREVLRGLHGALRYQLSDVDRFAVQPALLRGEIIPGRQIVATLTPELTLDRRDRPLDPHGGAFHLLALETGAIALGGDSDFLKGRFETHWFFEWLRPTVVALSGRIGLAGPLRGTRALPIEERFFAGGANTVRGYKEQRVGPLDASGHPTGGDAQVILNAEWRFPIFRWLGGAVFADTGAVTPDVTDLRLRSFKSGVGAGIRIATPVGALRFDAGYPLDSVPGQDRVIRYYLAVGYPF